jgi:eukaryotic-like serine/threonine-protein kinase
MNENSRTSPERWQQIERIYGQALEREGHARAALLEDACAGDAPLRHEVESLLACEPAAADFIETPALDIAADMLMRRADSDVIGRRIGPYVIDAWLGSGGMGDVYRARDLNLHRDVALKILPELFAVDPDRLARFKREAQVLASLNHPNIAAIYGFEEWNHSPGSGSTPALALELVEGPTLAVRIAQGSIPLDEALPIARQIAEALEAAHEHGIIHRDLKPANIKLRPDGTVKLLDFGLAKAMQPEAVPAGDVTPASMPRVVAGVILGTAAYVSPEQAKGRQADKRSDVWAFGAVLYEMLSGRRAFEGESTAEILASIVGKDVDLTALPASTPESVRHLIVRCLSRDVRQRLRDVGEARIALEEPLATAVGEAEIVATLRPPRRVWRRAISLALAVIFTAAIAAAFAWYLRPVPTLGVTRFSFTLPEGQVLSRGIGRHSIAISPDGAQMVYSSVPAGLHLRSMSQLAAKVIAGTEVFSRVTEPVFSPDGRSVAFYADQALKRIAVAGGSPVTIAPVGTPYGISWGPAGIVFGQGRDGIMRVSANGGKPEMLVSVEEGQEAHGPQLLPGGQHVLFTLASGTAGDRWNKARIVVQSLTSGKRVTLIDGGSDARYVSTGHIVYALRGIVYAVAFDLQRLELTGSPMPIVEGVSRATGSQTGAAHFSVSDTGSLVYIPGSVAAAAGLGETLQLALIDRSGRVEPLPLAPDAYLMPRVSPDGGRIVFGTDDGTEAIVWVYDLSADKPKRRLTFGGNNRFPIWSRDGQHVVFQSDRAGDVAIFWQRADGTGTAERLTRPDRGTTHVPESWSPNGDNLLYSINQGSDAALWKLSLPNRQAAPFGDIHSSTPIGAAFSPDGRWVAYASAERGTQTIYVQPFPATGAKYQLIAKTSDTPCHPVWSPDGRELFYNPRPRGLEVVSVTTAPAFAFGSSSAVPRPFQLTPPEQRRAYDITPAGKFVARAFSNESQSGASADTQIQVVLNWFEELKARVPVR